MRINKLFVLFKSRMQHFLQVPNSQQREKSKALYITSIKYYIKIIIVKNACLNIIKAGYTS